MRAVRIAALIAVVILVAVAGYQFIALQRRIGVVEKEQLALKGQVQELEQSPPLEQEHAVIFFD